MLNYNNCARHYISLELLMLYIIAHNTENNIVIYAGLLLNFMKSVCDELKFVFHCILGIISNLLLMHPG